MTMTDTPYRLLPIDDVRESADNLRQHLGDLDDLVASVKALGIIEPIVVDADNVVLAGHRRLAAAFEAGLTHVPAVVRTVADDAEATEIMLVENLQRSGLNPIEEATGYSRLVGMGMTQHEIAERVGCNQSHVSKRIALTKLPEAARAMVVDGSLKVNDALELVKLVELDPASADEWIAKPEWPSIAQRIRNVETDRRKAASIAEGEASGLIDAREMGYSDLVGLDRDVDRDVATHWSLNGIGEIVWWGPHPKRDKEAEPAKPKPEKAKVPSVAEQRYALDRERRQRREAAVAGALARVGRDRVVEWAFDLGARMLREDLGMFEVSDRGLKLDDVDQDDHALVVALGALDTILTCIEDQDAESILDADRWAMTALVEFGYEQDEGEVELFGKIVPGVIEERPDDAEPGEQIQPADLPPAVEPTTVEEVDEWRFDGPTHAGPSTAEEADELDEHKSAAPWKAYPFVDEVRLIGGIREHGNVDKLRHAVTYERANANRELVLAALAERIDELTGVAP